MQDSKGQDHVALFFMGEQDAADLLEKVSQWMFAAAMSCRQ